MLWLCCANPRVSLVINSKSIFGFLGLKTKCFKIYTYNVPEECRKLADILREWKVSMIVNNPVGGKAKYTEKKITETEVKDEVKHRISNHTKLLTKLLLNWLFEVAQITEGDDSNDITDNSNNLNHINDRHHPETGVSHRQWLTAELGPIGNEPRFCAVWVGSTRIWIKPSTYFFCGLHVIPVK